MSPKMEEVEAEKGAGDGGGPEGKLFPDVAARIRGSR